MEERDADRFRLYVNRTIGNGAEVLTPAAVFVINIGAVWMLDVVVIYLAWRVDLGLGLIAVYLMLINAVIHIGGALHSRSYNPGLVTAVVLFLPAGGYALWRIQSSGAATTADHLIGLVIGAAVHALIVVYALRRKALLLRPACSHPKVVAALIEKAAQSASTKAAADASVRVAAPTSRELWEQSRANARAAIVAGPLPAEGLTWSNFITLIIAFHNSLSTREQCEGRRAAFENGCMNSQAG